MNTILLATRNSGKLREISSILHGIPYTLVSVGDMSGIPDVVEDGSTLEKNALKKARETFAATGIPSLSDDTGLEVFALNMRPGVRSARYAGEHASYSENNKKLLVELEKLSSKDRRAQFRCVAAFIDGGVEHVTTGICAGVIGMSSLGEGGFGYDPLFVPDGFEETFAELTQEIKNTISHRSRAFRLMKKFLISRHG